MGLSVSAAVAIICSSLIFIAVVLYGTVNNTFNASHEAFQDDYDWEDDRKNTDIDISYVYYNKTSNELTIYVYNDGEITLNLSEGNLLLDGILRTIGSIEVDGSTTGLVLPTETADVTLNITGIGLSYDANANPRTYTTVTTNLTSPRNLSVMDRVYVIDNDGHIDIFTTEGVFSRNFTHAAIANPTDISVSSRYMFVINDNTSNSNNYTIWRFDLDGTSALNVTHPADGRPSSISATEDGIYVANDTNEIYWYDTSGARRTLLNNTLSPRDIYVTGNTSDDYIYVLNTTGEVWRLTTDGRNATELVEAGNVTGPRCIAVSDINFSSNGHIYIVNNSREIKVCDLSGDSNSAFSDGLSDDVWAVDVTAKLYVTDRNNGLLIENLGAVVKVVAENGISATYLI